MTNAEAIKAIREYYDIENPREDDDILYTEALKFLIEETQDPKYMTELAWYYCAHKRFDIEIKYLELAAECGYVPAFEELGYMWYYGQHGVQDYEKAFHYFSKGAEKGGLWCKYKLADMYRFGCFVPKDEARYCQIIEEVYEEIKHPTRLNQPFPEVSLRLAGIRDEQGRTDEAIDLLKKAKEFMAERLSMDPFWGHIEVMGRIVRFLDKISIHVPSRFPSNDFYDLFIFTETPSKYYMGYRGRRLELEVIEENGEKAIGYNGKWYRSFEDFCAKAEVDGKKFTSIYDEISDIRDEAYEWIPFL